MLRETPAEGCREDVCPSVCERSDILGAGYTAGKVGLSWEHGRNTEGAEVAGSIFTSSCALLVYRTIVGGSLPWWVWKAPVGFSIYVLAILNYDEVPSTDVGFAILFDVWASSLGQVEYSTGLLLWHINSVVLFCSKLVPQRKRDSLWLSSAISGIHGEALSASSKVLHAGLTTSHLPLTYPSHWALDLREAVHLDLCQDAKHSAVGLPIHTRLADLGLNLEVYPTVRR